MYKLTTTLLAALMGTATAHMEMRFPPPLNSKYNPHTDPSSIDYSMTSPLAQDGSDYPCKGYHALLGTPAGRPAASLEAGSRAAITVSGGATHGGGSCQVSLSTDGARTFAVLKSVIGGCPAATHGDAIDFVVPLDVPAGEAVLAWSWHNRIGNREMYMNCAAVTLTRGAGGGGGSSRQQMHGGNGDAHRHGVAYSSLPGIFVANVGNGCSVAEGGDVVYPDPGVDVVDQSTNPLAPSGECGSSSSSSPPAAPPSGHKGSKGRYRPAGSRHPDAAIAAPQRSTTTTTTPPKAAKELPRFRPHPEPGSSGSGFVPPSTGSEDGSGHSAPGTSSCADDGAWDCLAGGVSFRRCASGQWSAVMSMPAGTVCVPGVGGSLDMQDARY